MNHLRCTALLLAALLACTLAACFGGGERGEASSSPSQARQEEPDPNWPVAIGDIRVAEKPERIVSLSPALTEVLYELGGGDRMAGVSAYCDFPADIGDLPDCGTAQSPDLNRLRELSPDVVFVSAPLTQAHKWLCCRAPVRSMRSKQRMSQPRRSLTGCRTATKTAGACLARCAPAMTRLQMPPAG